MGSTKLDMLAGSANLDRVVEKIFSAAFGPSPALYRHVSLCGWRIQGNRHRPIHHQGNVNTRHDHGTLTERTTGIEIIETCEAMTIQVALTYVKEESLHLSISGKTVIIRGERIMATAHENAVSYPLEGQTRFQRLIALPATVKAGGFRAQLKGDVVRIDFAKHRMQ